MYEATINLANKPNIGFYGASFMGLMDLMISLFISILFIFNYTIVMPSLVWQQGAYLIFLRSFTFNN
jgi:hypothetical protein